MIEFKNVSKSLDNNLIIENLNLNIDEGIIFGLVGVNGSGKTTLLRCLSGIYKADQGEILLDGDLIYENTTLKKEIFYLGDDCFYSSNATIDSLIDFYKSFYEIDETKLTALLEEFNLNINKRIDDLSKGLKKQLFLIIALSLKIKILILDEALDNLDPVVKKRLKELIIETVKGVLILISHCQLPKINYFFRNLFLDI